MSEETPEQELARLIRETPADLATLAMVKQIFTATAEIHAVTEAILPVIGAIAGKVGISGAQIDRLVNRDA